MPDIRCFGEVTRTTFTVLGTGVDHDSGATFEHSSLILGRGQSSIFNRSDFEGALQFAYIAASVDRPR